MKKDNTLNILTMILISIAATLAIIAVVLLSSFIWTLTHSDNDEMGTAETVYYADNVPDYFLEPKGYKIAEIVYSNNVESGSVYGYISNDDYKDYQKGTGQTIMVLDPYEKDGFTKVITCVSVESITIGVYKDVRTTYKLNK